MELNLTIIADYLTDTEILFKRTDWHTKRALKFPTFYNDENTFQEDRVYIAYAEKLTQTPISNGTVSIICLGYPPAAYNKEGIELICIPTNTDIFSLMNHVLELFNYFHECEKKMNAAAGQNHSFEEIANIAFSIFQTPVSAFNRYDKYLFLKYNPSRPEFIETYHNLTQDDYSYDEERSVFLADKDFQETYHTHGPAYANSPIFGTESIYMNIFEGKQYIGRVLIENAYRAFRESDYTLIEWLAEHLQNILIQAGIFHFGGSKEFEMMMRFLLLEHRSYQQEYDHILSQQNWRPTDSYLCVHIRTTISHFQSADANIAAFYLKELFDSHYILVDNGLIYQVINLSKSQYSKDEILRRLQLFLNNNDHVAGLSIEFNDFSRIWDYLQQAILVTEYHRKTSDRRIFEFERNVLHILLQNAKGSFAGDFFITGSLARLFKYDKENNAELVHTLKCYLKHNLNVTKTQEELHIARTTCLYRIQRIENITHLNLNDPDTQLYTLILFRLLGC